MVKARLPPAKMRKSVRILVYWEEVGLQSGKSMGEAVVIPPHGPSLLEEGCSPRVGGKLNLTTAEDGAARDLIVEAEAPETTREASASEMASILCVCFGRGWVCEYDVNGLRAE
jgi:hypothetical protein